MEILSDRFKNLNIVPFFFVGSGLTRRYYSLPNWKELLTHFASRLSSDPYAINAYFDRVRRSSQTDSNPYPKVAGYIENDFNEKWFNDPSFRQINEEEYRHIESNCSPFKVEISHYISEKSFINPMYKKEVSLFRRLSEKHLAGIITTNYDEFLEKSTDNYRCFSSQDDLLSTSAQGVAEIYKIHGSVKYPASIVITETDYLSYRQKRKYLTAKLMTLFVENPIFFIGYSLNDQNINDILLDIVETIPSERLSYLENKFFFIDYQPSIKEPVVLPYGLNLNGMILPSTSIQLSDFSDLYKSLFNIPVKIPVRIIRKFKIELSSLVKRNGTSAVLLVTDIDNPNVNDDQLVLSIGAYEKELSKKGLQGFTAGEWYRNIILGDSSASADDLLTYVFHDLNKQNSGLLPFYKLLASAKRPYPDIESLGESHNFEFFISNTIRRSRKPQGEGRTVATIVAENKAQKSAQLIAYLTESEINVDELEAFLMESFNTEPDLLSLWQQKAKTDMRRLIRIYDFLKFNKKKPAK